MLKIEDAVLLMLHADNLPAANNTFSVDEQNSEPESQYYPIAIREAFFLTTPKRTVANLKVMHSQIDRFNQFAKLGDIYHLAILQELNSLQNGKSSSLEFQDALGSEQADTHIDEASVIDWASNVFDLDVFSQEGDKRTKLPPTTAAETDTTTGRSNVDPELIALAAGIRTTLGANRIVTKEAPKPNAHFRNQQRTLYLIAEVFSQLTEQLIPGSDKPNSMFTPQGKLDCSATITTAYALVVKDPAHSVTSSSLSINSAERQNLLLATVFVVSRVLAHLLDKMFEKKVLDTVRKDRNGRPLKCRTNSGDYISLALYECIQRYSTTLARQSGQKKRAFQSTLNAAKKYVAHFGIPDAPESMIACLESARDAFDTAN